MTSLLLLGLLLAAEPPTGRAMRGSLQQEVAAMEGPAWIGYAVAAVPFNDSSCGSNDKVPLEGFREAWIFVRVEARSVVRVRRLTPDCDIDTADLPLLWLTGVTPAESIAFLKQQSAVDAIGPHAGVEATEALERFVTPLYSDKIRRRAAHWLGATRGQRGVDLLVKLLREEPVQSVREDLVSGLGQAKEAVPVLIALTKGNDAKLRQKAMYWLARSQDAQARRYVEEILAR